MQYSYYPGCASEGNAMADYHALLAVMETLGVGFEEIEDWNCCGATVTSGAIGKFPAQVLAARNLALAEKKQQDVVASCSSCYAVLGLANQQFANEQYRKKANLALKEDDLQYTGSLKVRFILDVLVNDIGAQKIAAVVKKPLTGLKVACYVGCQSVKVLPDDYDDSEYPTALDKIVTALGAEPIDYENKMKCCTAALALTDPAITAATINLIVEGATKAGADIIVTSCPLCQMNLDAYQARANKQAQTDYHMPVLFISQLMALAMGLSAKQTGLSYCIVSPAKKLANWI